MNALGVCSLHAWFVENRCPGSAVELRELASVCVSQGFRKPDDFDSAEPPSDCDAFSVCCKEAVLFLEELIRIVTAKCDRVRQGIAFGDRSSLVPASRVSVAAKRPVSASDVIEVVKRGCVELSLPQLDKGPAAARKALIGAFGSNKDAAAWSEAARQKSILDSAPRSSREIASAVRCWRSFAVGVLRCEGECLPPSVDGIVAWSQMFKHKATFSNYVGKLKAACELMGVSSEALVHPSVARSKRALDNRSVSKSSPKPAVRREQLGRLMKQAEVETDLASAMLYCCAYAFLLRVPSEGLPLIRVSADTAADTIWDNKPLIWCAGGEVLVKLPRRRNVNGCCTLTRSCWCAKDRCTCPVHRLGLWLDSLPVGALPFAHLKPEVVNSELRRRASLGGFSEFKALSSKGFRRGHARDMVQFGSRIGEILAAGQWKSPAFLQYLDWQELEAAAVVEAVMAESASEAE
jgi:hypothetical protein